MINDSYDSSTSLSVSLVKMVADARRHGKQKCVTDSGDTQTNWPGPGKSQAQERQLSVSPLSDSVSRSQSVSDSVSQTLSP